MVSFKLAAFLAATTFVACALAAPAPHSAANVALPEALARRSGASPPASGVTSESRSSNESAHGDASSDSATSALRAPPIPPPIRPIRPIPVRFRFTGSRLERLEPIRPQAVQSPGESGSLRPPAVDEAGPSRRPNSPRPDSIGPSTRRPNRSSSSGSPRGGNHALEDIPERPPSRGAEASGEDRGQ